MAIEHGTAFAARDADGATIGFGCHSVNRAGVDRPDGHRPDVAARRRRLGASSRAVAPTSTRAGTPTGEIAWVSNLRFYGKCGATVSRVFQGGQLAADLTDGRYSGRSSATERQVRAPAVSGRNCSSVPKSPAIFTWPRMNPTRQVERAVVQRLPRRRASTVNVMSAGSARCPSPALDDTRSPSTSRPAARLFLLARGDDELDDASASGTVDARARMPANRSSSNSPSRHAGVDERARER